MHIIFIQRILLTAALLVSQSVFAQLDPVEAVNFEEESVHAQATDNAEKLPVKEVEIGSGGNIKLERKYRTKIENQYEWHAHLLWESRYVTEGRDNLSADSLVSVSTEFSIDEFSVIPWFADSAAADYSEFNLNIVNGARLTNSLVLYAGYSYVYSRFSGGKGSDNEIGLDLVYKWFKHVNALASIYHSFDAHGSFMEWAIKYNNALNKHVHYGVQGVLGVNAGYVPDGHNGLNHYQLRANASYHPMKQIELYAYTGYNVAIDREVNKYAGDELLRDFFWGGVGITYLF